MAAILGSGLGCMSRNRGHKHRLFGALAAAPTLTFGDMNIPFIRPGPAAGALLLACAGLAGAPVAAQGTALDPDTLARALALAGDAASALAPRGARVVALPGTLDARLALAPCARIEPYLPAGVRAWGRSRVGLRCTAGTVRWNVFLPVTVQVFAPAAVAAQALPAGTHLDVTQLQEAEIDWAAAPTLPLAAAEHLAGRVLSRPLAAGQPVLAADLQPRQWFAIGDAVRIVAGGNGYSVVADGEALTPGFEGQSARVRTEGGRVLVARPVGQHRVEVGL
jgi:flagella basal body P-ring formation protein FlgA